MPEGPRCRSLGELVAELRTLLASFEPGCLTREAAVGAVEAFAELERLAAAGKALAARRVEESGAWRTGGHRSAAHWMAARTGTPVGQAVTALEAVRRLEHLPATAEALRAGRLSTSQVSAVSAAAAVRPDAEAGLLASAATDTVAALRERCRRVQATVGDAEARYERVRAGRYLRHWTDADGAVRVDARLTADAGATLLAAVEVGRRRMVAEARASRRREPLEAYDADALVALAGASRPTGTSAVPPATVHVRVDHTALVRGHAEGDEVCDIPGIGPIPVAAARRLADDSILKIIVTKGADVVAVAHAGRTIPAPLRTALEARDPTCVVPGCDVRDHLEIDHRVPVADHGPTTLANLNRLCGWHHYLKTHQGYRLGGGPAGWTWAGPDAASDDAGRAPLLA